MTPTSVWRDAILFPESFGCRSRRPCIIQTEAGIQAALNYARLKGSVGGSGD